MKTIMVGLVVITVCGLSYFAINQLLSVRVGMNEIITTPIINDTSKISDKYKVKIETKSAKNVDVKEQQEVISEIGSVQKFDGEK